MRLVATSAGGRRKDHPAPRRGASHARRRAKVAVALVLSAVVLDLGLRADHTVTTGNLVVNGSFDDGLDGWTTNRATTDLSRSTTAHSGSHAALLSPTSAGRDVIIDDSPNTVSSTEANTTYDVSGWVRTDTPTISGQLRVREVGAGHGVGVYAKSFRLSDDDWTYVTFSFTTDAPGDSLDLSVVGWELGETQRLYVDDLSLVDVGPSVQAPTATPTPTSSVPPPARPSGPGIATLSNGVSISDRGIPASGALVGAAVGGNTDPASFERQIGQRLGVRRTYWGPDDVDRSVRLARDDLARGTLPWISFKPPHSWAAMADGQGDAWATDLADKLSRLPGPVWVAFYHEPETHGNIADWTRMQERLGPILRQHAPNAAFTLILTGYHEFQGEPQYSLDSLWPDTTVDLVGFDLYNYYGTLSKAGKIITEPSDLDRLYFEPIGRWAAAKGVAWGLAETGLNDAAADRYPELMSQTYQSMVADGGAVFTYFNSRLNSTSSWEITTRAKADQFAAVEKASPTFPKFV